LIKSGAKLTETVDDIVEEFPHWLPSSTVANGSRVGATAPAQELDSASQRLLQACGYESSSVDEMVLRSGLTVQEVCSMLLPLELAGLVKLQSDGTWIRVS